MAVNRDRPPRATVSFGIGFRRTYGDLELGIKWSRLPSLTVVSSSRVGPAPSPRPWLDDVPSGGQWDAVLMVAVGPE